MTKGEAAVHETLGGFMLVGVSLQHLWFYKDHRGELILPSNQAADAYRCADCKLTVIDGESHRDQASSKFGRKLGTKYAKWKNRRREQGQ
ncbi:MAG: hypothetical protein L3J39_16865 [Verrucomicrobiales bacterium]|nr:hypothetical protein [Verrucomicrobiales bacterium]